MTPGKRLGALADLDRVVADSLRFKLRLRIGEDAYALRRLTKSAFSWWDSASAAGTGVTVAKSAALAGTFFAPAAPTGFMAWLGLAAPAVAVTPVGWVAAGAVLAGGGYYGVTRWWSSRPDDSVDVIPRFINTPIDQLGAALADFIIGLALLVASADGVIDATEREALTDHLVRDWGYDPAYVATALPLLEAEFDPAAVEASARAMAAFLRANPDCNTAAMQAELIDFLRELIAADGQVTHEEVAAVAAIEASFAAEARWSLAQVAGELRGALATAGAAVAEATPVARQTLAMTGKATGRVAVEAQKVLVVAGARTVEVVDTARTSLSRLLRQRS